MTDLLTPLPGRTAADRARSLPYAMPLKKIGVRRAIVSRSGQVAFLVRE